MSDSPRYLRALEDIAGLAEQRRGYDRDELTIRMGDIANQAVWDRRGPGTEGIAGYKPEKCRDCKTLRRACTFHTERGR